MKKILITGKNSYIGTSFEKWVADESDKYQVDSISVRGESWKEYDFSKYDTVLHVAGLVHKKETKSKEDEYFKINRDLAYEVAYKAKKEGIKQFIFLSTMSVYGMQTGVITNQTQPNPSNLYGQSKLEAEVLISKLQSAEFKVVILRPPMVYGKDSPGNYQLLKNFALISPIFPDFENKRSMISIENLSKFIKILIKDNNQGLFLPQDNKYIITSEMVSSIARENNKSIRLTKLFNPIIKLLLRLNIDVFLKVFGTLKYTK